jgi:phage N-6-adenine-methyltransferase
MSNFSQRFKTNIATVTQKGVRQDWETPDELFNPLNDEFHFTLDVAASPENAKCSTYYTEENDGLLKEWSGVCWMNPPFDNKTKWIKKAYQEAQKGATVVCLVPARTNTNWWHDICMKGEVRFIRGRPKFKGAKHGLPNPLAIVVFTPSNNRMHLTAFGVESPAVIPLQSNLFADEPPATFGGK